MNAMDTLRQLRGACKSFVDACDGILTIADALRSPQSPAAAPFLPAAIPAEQQTEGRRSKATRKSKGHRRASPVRKVRTDSEPIASEANNGDLLRLSHLQGEIMQVLRVMPSTSTILFERLKKKGVATTLGSVYATCSDLKGRKIIETRRNELSGSVEWHPLNRATEHQV